MWLIAEIALPFFSSFILLFSTVEFYFNGCFRRYTSFSVRSRIIIMLIVYIILPGTFETFSVMFNLS